MAAMLHRGLYSLGVITCIATVSIRCYYRLCRSEQEKEKKGQREGTQIQASEEKWEALIAPGMRKEVTPSHQCRARVISICPL
mmetsp:Transcript_19005/g.31276  ORF Transcript_19005/g.31276 Transcript_19005/m.31276 type:complete len:83 (+) Transcript_19005:219-467(+)